MHGELREDKVVLGKGAVEELYESLGYGRPKEEKLELSMVEAAYLLERERIEVKLEGREIEFKELFKIASQFVQDFELKYIVYKDLRERGYYVQPSIADFRLYPRGGKPREVASEYFVHVVSERKAIALEEIVEQLSTARNMRKKLMLAIVDEESDLTYYEIGYFQAQERKKRELIAAGEDEEVATLLEDRVIIWKEELSRKLHYERFFGKPLDEKRLQLSLVEAAYLIEKGEIKVRDRKDEAIGLNEFIEFAKANPGKITIGMSGKLSGHHMASLQFMKMTETKLTLVTFTGAAPQVTALLGGHVEAIWGNSSDLVSHGTEMKILAIGTEKRMDTLPNVPTFQEQGMKFYPRIDRGVAVPKNTPPDITDKLEKAFLETVNKEDYHSKIVKAGFVPMGLNSQQSIKYITEQTEIFKKLLIEHNLLLQK